MWLAFLTAGVLAEPPPLDLRLLFLTSVVTVVTVTAFGAAVLIVLLRRTFQRRLAEQKLAAIGTTTARILHQIKNPVQSLLLQAELLEGFEREDMAEARREAVADLLSEAHRLAALLNELSIWLSGNRRPLAPTPARLDLLVQGVAHQVQRLLEAHGVSVEVGQLDPVEVPLDGYYLHQALENLIRNAEEAMRGQPDPRVRLEVVGERGYAFVRVTDNGPGIPPERREQIFEPFVSTKGSGMGLGLAIAREIVEGHGGVLQLESPPDGGSSFCIRLPLAGTGPVQRGRNGRGFS